MKCLVYKTGETETFVTNDPSGGVSLGDVLRTYPAIMATGYEITWVTSPVALSLMKPLENASLIFQTELPQEVFDLVINLERTSQSASLSSIPSARIVGFSKTNSGWAIKDSNGHAVTLQEWNLKHRGLSWGQKLFKLLDLPHHPTKPFYPKKTTEKLFDLGFNWRVGSKWPEKQMPYEHWESLHRRWTPVFTISWQQGHENLHDYVRWISSCRVIMTSDSLGLHVAQAMGIPVLGLFGPTDPNEIDWRPEDRFLSFQPLPAYDTLDEIIHGLRKC